MKFVYVTLFLILLIALPAFSQIAPNDKRSVDELPDRTSVNGFGGRLVVIENPREFVQKWLKPEIPRIKSAAEVRRGDTLGGFVLFTGCKSDAQGGCHSEVDYTIYRPDGSIYADRKGQPLVQEQTYPPPNIQLGRAIPVFRMGKDDPAGEYRVKTKVSDLNANVHLELETRFRLR